MNCTHSFFAVLRIAAGEDSGRGRTLADVGSVPLSGAVLDRFDGYAVSTVLSKLDWRVMRPAHWKPRVLFRPPAACATALCSVEYSLNHAFRTSQDPE